MKEKQIQLVKASEINIGSKGIYLDGRPISQEYQATGATMGLLYLSKLDLMGIEPPKAQIPMSEELHVDINKAILNNAGWKATKPNTIRKILLDQVVDGSRGIYFEPEGKIEMVVRRRTDTGAVSFKEVVSGKATKWKEMHRDTEVYAGVEAIFTHNRWNESMDSPIAILNNVVEDDPEQIEGLNTDPVFFDLDDDESDEIDDEIEELYGCSSDELDFLNSIYDLPEGRKQSIYRDLQADIERQESGEIELMIQFEFDEIREGRKLTRFHKLLSEMLRATDPREELSEELGRELPEDEMNEIRSLGMFLAENKEDLNLLASEFGHAERSEVYSDIMEKLRKQMKFQIEKKTS